MNVVLGLETLTNYLPFFRGAPAVPGNRLEIKDRDALAGLLDERLAPIRADVGVGEQAWNELYATLFLNYAEFVQGCPASEAHHHRGSGGMLEHGIEVSGIAARACDRALLPPASTNGSGKPGTGNQRERWMYAIVMAALLHDIGKLLVDMKISLYDMKQGSVGLWLPAIGPMTCIDKAAYYSIDYRPERKYHLHEQCGQMLLPHLVPTEGMAWLLGDLKLFGLWVAAVSGNLENAGVIGEIVRTADGQSAAADAGSSAQSPDPQAARPLHETLLMAMRDLVLNSLKMNAPGAAGFVKDGEVYLVSKTVLDEVRRHLFGRGITNLPANPRLMDVLTEAKRLIVTEDGKAVWSRRINVGEFDQVLTVLRLSEEKLLGGSFPAGDFEGTIEAADGESGKEDAGDVREKQSAAPAEKQASGADNLPAAPGDIQASPSDADEPANEPADGGEQDLGQQFRNWLVAGIESGELPVNTGKSQIHMVPNGAMFLVSPAIFQAFSQIDPDWADVQKSFQQMGLCAREEGADSNLYAFTVRPRGTKLTGYLIDNAAETLGLGDLPAANKMLEPYTEEGG